jgi:hypothetical protein
MKTNPRCGIVMGDPFLILDGGLMVRPGYGDFPADGAVTRSVLTAYARIAQRDAVLKRVDRFARHKPKG